VNPVVPVAALGGPTLDWTPLAPGPKCCGRVLLLPRPARPQHLSGAHRWSGDPARAEVHDRGGHTAGPIPPIPAAWRWPG